VNDCAKLDVVDGMSEGCGRLKGSRASRESNEESVGEGEVVGQISRRNNNFLSVFIDDPPAPPFFDQQPSCQTNNTGDRLRSNHSRSEAYR
jgi:hypothetical protein